MKQLVFLPFVLLLGLLIGGWGPRSDLRQARKEAEAAKALLKEKGVKKGDMQSVTRLLGINERASAAPRSASKDRTNEAAPLSTEVNTNTNSSDSVADIEKEEEDNKSNAERMRENINKAVELWQVRSDIARNSFIYGTHLKDKDIVKFDVLMEAMNLRLGDRIDRFADEMEQNENPRPEDGLRVVNDITEIVVNTYDEMDRTLPETWREGSGEDFQLMDFIDPSIATPLIDVQDKIEGATPRDK